MEVCGARSSAAGFPSILIAAGALRRSCWLLLLDALRGLLLRGCKQGYTCSILCKPMFPQNPKVTATAPSTALAPTMLQTLQYTLFTISFPQNPKVTADRAFNGFGTNYEGSPEPIYGQLFLPRKFKIAVTGEQCGVV